MERRPAIPSALLLPAIVCFTLGTAGVGTALMTWPWDWIDWCAMIGFAIFLVICIPLLTGVARKHHFEVSTAWAVCTIAGLGMVGSGVGYDAVGTRLGALVGAGANLGIAGVFVVAVYVGSHLGRTQRIEHA